MDEWLPGVYIEPRTKFYKFEIHDDGWFNWRHGQKKDGNPFLILHQ
jgi:hypothetical protein